MDAFVGEKDLICMIKSVIMKVTAEYFVCCEFMHFPVEQSSLYGQILWSYFWIDVYVYVSSIATVICMHWDD